MLNFTTTIYRIFNGNVQATDINFYHNIEAIKYANNRFIEENVFYVKVFDNKNQNTIYVRSKAFRHEPEN